MPKVSVIIPVYNGAKYIEETLRSVYAQTFQDFEIIAVDDGSTDNISDIMRKYTDRVKFISQENKGISAARNKAILESTGEYLAFIDQDDLWLPQKLEKQIALFEKNPKVGLVFCDTIFFNEKGDLYNIYRKESPARGMVFGELLSNYFLSLETVVIRKKALLSLAQWFDEQFNMAEEMDLFLRIAYKWELDYVNEPLAKWRMHESSYSRKRSDLVPKEMGMVLDKILKIFPDIMQKYSEEIECQKRMIDYQWAFVHWEKGEKRLARKYLWPHILKNRKMLLVYLAVLLPYRVFNSLREFYFRCIDVK